MSSLICVKCGKKAIKNEIFCVDCFPISIKVKPIKMFFCSRCRRYRLKEWKALSKEELKDHLIGKIKVNPGVIVDAELDFKNKKATLFIAHSDNEFKREINFDIEFVRTICTRCSKKAGGYFEAIIQLRGNKEKFPYLFKKIEKMLVKKGEFISKVEERKEGIDIFTSSSKLSREILNELGLSYKMSRKLHGLKEGKRIYRLTLAVRVE